MSTINQLKKFLFNDHLRREFLELRRLSKLPRYKKSKSKILGFPIHYTDAASFVFTYKEIFKSEIYKFKSDNPSPYIIDGGANLGLATLYLKSLFPKSKIICFEPDNVIYDALEKNIEASGVSGVELVKKALWSEETTLTFYSEGADGGHIVSQDQVEEKKSLITIPTVKLTDYLGQQVDFLKLDIEGAETEVIVSCQDHLTNVQRIFIEYHSYAKAEQRLNEILEILRRNEFTIHVTSPGLNSPKPFDEILVENNMDFQLNIFGFKNESTSYKYL